LKSVSVALKAHLAGRTTTLATCWKCTRTDGTVLGFTDHDRDITYSGVTYVATTDALDVDNLEVQGKIEAPSITEADLAAGLWDYARFEIFQINWADTTMGVLKQRTGRLGKVTLKKGVFVAEFRGLMQAYTRTVGEITSPMCRAQFGDTRCTKSLAAYTVTGTLTGVNPDNQTLYDTARAEAGPTGGATITDVTNADPGVITVDDLSDFVDGDAVTISGVGGMTRINGVTLIRSKSENTFALAVDTSDTDVYEPYTSGGTVTPLGGSAGYFDYGLITFTSGANVGLSMEIKSYVPGQFVLQLPLPYAAEAGDEYTAVAGCNKSRATCRDTFDNLINFRGEPDIPGQDKLIQVGKPG